MANTRTIDKTKKSNIKCEHCAHWDKDMAAMYNGKACTCADSPKYNTVVNYWNRCKKFVWR